MDRSEFVVFSPKLTNFSRRSYTGVPVNKEYCPFTIKVYPSSQKQAYYQTSNPIIFTAAAVLIFVFTSAVFLLYDYMVERRQKKVLSTAVRSTAIVSSLFPAVVRDRLFPVDEEAPASPTKQTRTFAAVGLANPKNRLKNFLNDGKTLEDMEDETERSTSVSKSAPIAELFPETTVLFADIAGFTAWSSIRDPAQVFTLLETLYGAFDSLAKKRGVFKVETIGDSYVAVCGLPEPRKNHAIVIARFAAGKLCVTAMTT